METIVKIKKKFFNKKTRTERKKKKKRKHIYFCLQDKNAFYFLTKMKNENLSRYCISIISMCIII